MIDITEFNSAGEIYDKYLSPRGYKTVKNQGNPYDCYKLYDIGANFKRSKSEYSVYINHNVQLLVLGFYTYLSVEVVKDKKKIDDYKELSFKNDVVYVHNFLKQTFKMYEYGNKDRFLWQISVHPDSITGNNYTDKDKKLYIFDIADKLPRLQLKITSMVRPSIKKGRM